MHGTPAWFPTNVACNSPTHFSNFEIRPLQFQRFRAYRKLTKGNCMRVFGEEQLLPADEAGTPQADARIVSAREPPATTPSHGNPRPRPLHTGAPGSRSQRRRVAASTTPSGVPKREPPICSNTTSVRQPLRPLLEDGGSRVDGLGARQRLTNPRPFSAQS